MPDPRATTRRRVLGTAVVGLAEAAGAGCSLDSLDPSPDNPTFTPTTSPTGAAGTGTEGAGDPEEPSADEALTLRVRRAVSQTEAATAAAVRRHATLSRDLGALTDLHRAHLRELGGPVRGGGAPPAAGSRRAARAGVVRAEARLQRTLLRAATDAESGPLALLLATMAASVAQHREAL